MGTWPGGPSVRVGGPSAGGRGPYRRHVRQDPGPEGRAKAGPAALVRCTSRAIPASGTGGMLGAGESRCLWPERVAGCLRGAPEVARVWAVCPLPAQRWQPPARQRHLARSLPGHHLKARPEAHVGQCSAVTVRTRGLAVSGSKGRPRSFPLPAGWPPCRVPSETRGQLTGQDRTQGAGKGGESGCGPAGTQRCCSFRKAVTRTPCSHREAVLRTPPATAPERRAGSGHLAWGWPRGAESRLALGGSSWSVF